MKQINLKKSKLKLGKEVLSKLKLMNIKGGCSNPCDPDPKFTDLPTEEVTCSGDDWRTVGC